MLKLPREHLKLEALASVNSVRQRGSWKNKEKMANGAIKKNKRFSLHSVAVPTLYPTISSWRRSDTRCIWGRERGESTRSTGMMLASSCLCGLLAPCLSLDLPCKLTLSVLEGRGPGRRQILQQTPEKHEPEQKHLQGR